jgi:hypothetical protein
MSGAACIAPNGLTGALQVTPKCSLEGSRRRKLKAHSICTTVEHMKTAQLPPVRVEASVREEIEAVLREGESLSEFVGKAAVEAARRRRAQEAFLARGRASLAEARRTGEFYAAGEVLEDMRERLQSRMQALRKGDGTPGTSR